jgi:hypothetical protein
MATSRIVPAQEMEPEGSGANGMPPGKDGGARRRTLRLDIVIIETDALIRQLIDAWRVYRAAIHPEISPGRTTSR